MKTLLWIDSFRSPYIGSWLHEYSPEYETKYRVVWLKNTTEFIDWIKSNELPDRISFDNESGYDCAKWLIDYCTDKELPECIVPNIDGDEDKISGLLSGFNVL